MRWSCDRKIYAIRYLHWRLDGLVTEEVALFFVQQFLPHLVYLSVRQVSISLLGELESIFVSVVLGIRGRLWSRASSLLDCSASWRCSIWVIAICPKIALFQRRSWFNLVFWPLERSRDRANSFVAASNRSGVVFGVAVAPWPNNLGVVTCTEAL